MATYAVGDLQGCYREFMALLELIKFSPPADRLWLTGDLVNRGPQSLAVLRAVKGLGENVVVVLGNHDLHLLGCAYAKRVMPRRRDTLAEVLAAADRDELLQWLRQQPLAHHNERLGYSMVHAGLAPQWTLATALACATEVSAALRADDFDIFLGAMYGNLPAIWNPALGGGERLRFITNCLTRIRCCDADGRLELDAKNCSQTATTTLLPWYAVPGRASAGHAIVFGHWSTLRLSRTECLHHQVYPLDTGAVWGGELTAMRLEDRELFHVKSTTAVAFD